MIVGWCLPQGGTAAIKNHVNMGLEEMTEVDSLEKLRNRDGNIFFDSQRYAITYTL